MGIEIHTRYLSIINKIFWITHKGLIYSFTSPYVDYFLGKFQALGGDYYHTYRMPGITNYKRVLSHSILISTYIQIISEPIVQNIFICNT